MGQPDGPITLTPEQLAELNKKLTDMRHEVNGKLAVIVAGVEMIRLKPQTAERMLSSMQEQSFKITELIKQYSAEFEKTLGITRP